MGGSYARAIELLHADLNFRQTLVVLELREFGHFDLRIIGLHQSERNSIEVDPCVPPTSFTGTDAPSDFVDLRRHDEVVLVQALDLFRLQHDGAIVAGAPLDSSLNAHSLDGRALAMMMPT